MESFAQSYDASMFRDTFEHEFTYLNGFMRNVHRYADKPALTDPRRDQTWSYEELNKAVNQLAHALLADDIGKNDLVMYQLLNSPEFAFLYLAPQKLGAVNCPINFRLAPAETAEIIDESKPDVYFYDADVHETAEKALQMAENKPARVVMISNSDDTEPLPGAVRYEDYISGQPETDPDIQRPVHIYDETTRLYTSGTTGRQKGVPINNINDVLSAHDVIMHFPLSPKDKTMNMTPWFHRGGLYSGGPNPTFYVGGEVVVLRKFTPRTVLEHVEKYDISFLIGAPPMLKLLYDYQKNNPRDLSELKGIVTMGAPLEREACIRYQETLTPNIFNGYGTSEAFWNTFLRPYDLPEMAGSAGRSCTDDDVAVVKIYPDRRAEPDDYVAKDNNETGEIIVKAPAKTTYSYINQPEEEKRVFYKGWIYIGDLGVWDEDEYVTVVGRKDDMIISSGENIYPVQVEEILNEHPAVDESVVVGVPDETRGEAVVAYIIKDDEERLTTKEIDKFCRNHKRLAVYKKPRYYRFVDEVPYTATGKKIHYKMREQAVKDHNQGRLERV
ncbi:MAG TPA: AMP-binding protein [Balneolaceae bacterium]|nr:AMP-binding protein [Balneolaceae bacterium]